MAKNEDNLNGLTSGVIGLTGVLNQGVKALDLFGVKSENLADTQARLQALMTTTKSLQEAYNNLNKDSVFQTILVANAKKSWAAAQTLLNTQLGIGVGLSKALMVSGVGVLIAGIGALAYACKKWSDEQHSVSEEQKLMNGLIGKASVNVAKVVTDFDRYKNIVSDSNSTERDKIKVLNELNEIYGDTFGKIADIGDLESQLINRAPAYIEMLTEKSRAQAAYDAVIENQKKYFSSFEKSDKEILDDKFGVLMTFFMSEEDIRKRAESERYILWEKNKQRNDLLFSMQQEAQQRMEKIAAENKFVQSAPVKSVTIDLKKEIEARNQLDKIQLDSRTKIDAVLLAAKKEAAKTKKEQLQLEHAEELKGIKKRFDEIDGLEKSLRKKDGSLSGDDRRLVEEARTALNLEIEDIKGRHKKELDSVDEASRESMKSVWNDVNTRFDTELDKNRKQVEQFYTDIVKKARDAGAGIEEMDALTLTVDVNMSKDMNKVNTDFGLKNLNLEQEIETKRVELSNRSLYIETDKQKRLIAIQQDYTKKQLEILKNATDDQLIKKRESLELDKALLDEQYQTLTEKQAIEEKYYLFKSSKERELLDMQLKNSEARRDFLDKDKTADHSEEIADLDRSIAKLKELKATTYAQTVQEGGQVMSQIGNTVSQFDKDLGGGLAIVGDLVGSAATLAMGIVSMNPQQIMQGAIQLAGSIANVISLNKEANETINKFNQGLVQSAIEYSLALINVIKDAEGLGDSIFNTDAGNKLTKGMEGYTAAIAKQEELMNSLGETTVKVGVKKKKFLGITTGTKDVFDGLLKAYPLLITDAEKLDRELAQTLLQSGNLSKEAETAINNIIKAEDAAAAAMDQVNNNLSSIAGSLGSDLQNALVAAFKSGDDAAVAFGESVEKIMEDLIAQMLFSTIFGEQFKELEDMMKASYSGGGDQSLTDDIAWFYAHIGGGIEAFNQGLRDAQNTNASYGFSLFEPEEGAQRQGISGSGGLAQASQESISELSGRMLAGNMLISEIRDQGNERKLYDQAVRNQLEVIAYNTGYCHYLLDIKNSLNDIELKGVKVKM